VNAVLLMNKEAKTHAQGGAKIKGPILVKNDYFLSDFNSGNRPIT
jgi:hypothetical protein